MATDKTDGTESKHPADLSDEPPIGTQVTDADGDVWERTSDGSWRVWESGDRQWRRPSASWTIIRCNFEPLHLTTDADRGAVGLSAGDPETNPDEALARVIFEAHCEDATIPFEFRGVAREVSLRAARAVREHIEAEHQCPGDISGWRCLLYRGHPGDHAAEGSIPYDKIRARADKAEVELYEWKARHSALRDDVAEYHDAIRRVTSRIYPIGVVSSLAILLDRDEKRGEQ